MEASEATLQAKDWECGELSSVLASARNAVGRGEGLMHDFAERVCTGYTSLLHTQAASYRDRLNHVLADAQLRCEHLGGYQVRVGECGHSFRLGDADRDEDRGGHTPPPEGKGDVVVDG